MHKHKMLKGSSRDTINENVKGLCACGYSEANATRVALRFAKKGKAADRAAKKVAHKSNKMQIELK